MDPSTQFCPNPACRDRGQRGQGNIGIHSQKTQRYTCRTCTRTFAATRGTVHYRLRTPAVVVTQVVTLLAHGCPPQAIVAAFGLDERTVAAWQQRAGAHCQKVHEHLVQAGQVDLGHVQADELYLRTCRPPTPGDGAPAAEQEDGAAAASSGRVWQAMAMAVPSRLWLGGVISAHRDKHLIRQIAEQIRACACSLVVLVCVDGLSSYVTAIGRVFRVPVRTGKVGRPRLIRPESVLLAQVVKTYAKRRVAGVTRHVVFGRPDAVERVLSATHTGTVINTAYIERLNATFRACSAPLTRRTRALAHQVSTLTAAMYLVGTVYNFCWVHDSLRLPATGDGRKWQERTPAMATGLTTQRWTLHELLTYQVPPAPWVAPKRRGRPPKARTDAVRVPKRRSRPSQQPPREVAA